MIPPSDIPAITALHDEYGLTAKEALVVLLLYQGGIILRERIRDVYCDYPTTTPVEARSAIKRIRAKVRPHITICTHYGIGYEMTPEARKTVQKIIKGSWKNGEEKAERRSGADIVGFAHNMAGRAKNLVPHGTLHQRRR
jgi:hypothetical protein